MIAKTMTMTTTTMKIEVKLKGGPERVIERAVVISVGSEYLRIETLVEKYHFPVANILWIKESSDD